jgi:hypothetical protein
MYIGAIIFVTRPSSSAKMKGTINPTSVPSFFDVATAGITK